MYDIFLLFIVLLACRWQRVWSAAPLYALLPQPSGRLFVLVSAWNVLAHRRTDVQRLQCSVPYVKLLQLSSAPWLITKNKLWCYSTVLFISISWSMYASIYVKFTLCLSLHCSTHLMSSFWNFIAMWLLLHRGHRRCQHYLWACCVTRAYCAVHYVHFSDIMCDLL